jgi:uncharacterized protein YfaP (DUF2135 family)
MPFLTFKEAVHAQFTKLIETGALFTVNVDKDLMTTAYLESFPEGTNPIFRERTEHDCNCCNSFIRTAGNVVAFIDGKVESIWDIEVGGHYQVVADAMAKLVHSGEINGIFLHFSKHVGVDRTPDNYSEVVWDHFHMQLPSQFVKPICDIPEIKGKAVNNHNALKRSTEEISFDAIDQVVDLILSKSIYKGGEHLGRVSQLKSIKKAFEEADNKEQFYWEKSLELGASSSFRNSVIGTLLVDLSEGKDLEASVKAYETKVAPENYKRSSALITQAMINRAQDTIEKLGLEDSLQRRHAVVEDITINDVIFADRSAKTAMGVLAGLKPTAKKEVKTDNVTDISIKDFISTVVPKVDSMELLVTGEHQTNFMSLVAPVNSDSPSITSWGNNFSWSYNGEIADSSMRKNVKAEGGNVDGVLRFSIQWNTPDRPYPYDLDAHCRAGSEHIYYNNRKGNCNSGTLDVDIIEPRGTAVENIIYTDLNKMPDGDYAFGVHNYSSTANHNGFTAEVEFEGKTLTFDHTAIMRGGQKVDVATVNKKNGKFTLKTGTPVSETSVEVYGVQSKEFHKVTLLMNSPNYWDCVENPKGNKHWFFILDGCSNKEPVRGFYNEFLLDSLRDHRKVFEALGAQMKVPFSENQLSGLGFSETQDNTVVVKVRGDINNTYKIKFN